MVMMASACAVDHKKPRQVRRTSPVRADRSRDAHAHPAREGTVDRGDLRHGDVGGPRSSADAERAPPPRQTARAEPSRRRGTARGRRLAPQPTAPWCCGSRRGPRRWRARLLAPPRRKVAGSRARSARAAGSPTGSRQSDGTVRNHRDFPQFSAARSSPRCAGSAPTSPAPKSDTSTNNGITGARSGPIPLVAPAATPSVQRQRPSGWGGGGITRSGCGSGGGGDRRRGHWGWRRRIGDWGRRLRDGRRIRDRRQRQAGARIDRQRRDERQRLDHLGARRARELTAGVAPGTGELHATEGLAAQTHDLDDEPAPSRLHEANLGGARRDLLPEHLGVGAPLVGAELEGHVLGLRPSLGTRQRRDQRRSERCHPPP